ALGQVARQRIATLHDEVRNDAMELDAIVKAGVGELLEVGDGVRRVLLIEVGDDGAAIRLERGLFWHAPNLSPHTRDEGQRSLSTHCSHSGRRAMQIARPCEIRRWDSIVHWSLGKSAIRSCSIFTGSD